MLPAQADEVQGDRGMDRLGVDGWQPHEDVTLQPCDIARSRLRAATREAHRLVNQGSHRGDRTRLGMHHHASRVISTVTKS